MKPFEAGDTVKPKDLSGFKDIKNRANYKIIAIFEGNAWVSEEVVERRTYVIGLQNLIHVEQ